VQCSYLCSSHDTRRILSWQITRVCAYLSLLCFSGITHVTHIQNAVASLTKRECLCLLTLLALRNAGSCLAKKQLVLHTQLTLLIIVTFTHVTDITNAVACLAKKAFAFILQVWGWWWWQHSSLVGPRVCILGTCKPQVYQMSDINIGTWVSIRVMSI